MGGWFNRDGRYVYSSSFSLPSSVGYVNQLVTNVLLRLDAFACATDTPTTNQSIHSQLIHALLVATCALEVALSELTADILSFYLAYTSNATTSSSTTAMEGVEIEDLEYSITSSVSHSSIVGTLAHCLHVLNLIVGCTNLCYQVIGLRHTRSNGATVLGAIYRNKGKRVLGKGQGLGEGEGQGQGQGQGQEPEPDSLDLFTEPQELHTTTAAAATTTTTSLQTQGIKS